MRLVLFSALLLNTMSIFGDGFFDLIGFGAGVPKSSNQSEILLTHDDKYRQIKSLLEEKLAAVEKLDETLLSKKLERVTGQIQALKVRLKDAPVDDYEFLQRKIQLYSEVQQEWIDIELDKKQYSYQIEQTIKAIDCFLKDPQFSDLKITIKSSYQFQEYQDLSKQLLSLEEEHEQLKEERRTLEEELAKIVRDIAQLELEIKNKEREQRALTQEGAHNKKLYDIRQAGEIIDVEKELFATRKENKEFKRKIILQELELVEFRLFITKSKIQITQENVITVERSLYVNQVDLHTHEAAYLQRKSELQTEQVQIAQRITMLSEERSKRKKEFEKINAQVAAPIKDQRLLTEWAVDTSTLAADPEIIRLGNINDAILRLEREINLLNARQDLVKAKIQKEDLSYRILNSWYNITQRRFKDDHLRTEEIAMYQAKEADLIRELSALENHEAAIRSFMGSETRALSNIKRRIEEMQAQVPALTEQYGALAVKERIDRLKASENTINKQLDLNGQILKTYSTIKSTLKDLTKEVDQVVLKLDKIGGIWHRSADAINLETLQTIAAEARLFGQELTSQLSTITIKQFWLMINGLKQPQKLIRLFIFLALFALLFLLCSRLWRYIAARAALSEEDSIVRSVGVALLLFIFQHSYLLLSMLGLFIAVFTNYFGESYCLIRALVHLFYLAAFLYLANRLLAFAARINEQYDNLIFNPSYEKRFMVVGSFLLYAVVILFFFKESFLELTYGKSLLPLVIDSLLSVIIRISIVLLVSKQFILSILPLAHPLGYWIRDLIDRYYLAAIMIIVPVIVLSDPYIGGYSKFITFVGYGSFYTALLVLGLLWLHAFIKQAAADLFFIMQEDVAKERFSYAKTTYGLFVVLNFAFLLCIGVLIGAHIWQQQIPYDRVYEVLNFEMFALSGTPPIPFTVRSLLVLISFIFGGFIAAWAFEKFVLDRVFTLFMLDAGVQNTASRISHYIIFVIVLFIGFHRVNLGGLIYYGLGALLLAVAWALKGPANDFFAYFTILIERSIKIGDYISLEEAHGDVSGVVRKITPRTTVLRKKNSTTIIVPNSMVTAASVINWNYTRGFFAFDDMIITVSYGTNVEKTRTLLMEVLEQNKHVLKNPTPIVRLNEFGENGYQFMARGFLSSANVMNQWDITSDIRYTIVKKLQEAGIELAAPIRVLKIKEMRGIQIEQINEDISS